MSYQTNVLQYVAIVYILGSCGLLKCSSAESVTLADYIGYKCFRTDTYDSFITPILSCILWSG